MSTTIHAETLKRAAQFVGGREALRAHLNVSPMRLAAWMDGMLVPPRDVFLRAVDLVLEHQLAHLRAQAAYTGGRKAPSERD